ncbi:polysaccharide pyruvyl transferase family protein [Pseudomonas nicosulfuronedens]
MSATPRQVAIVGTFDVENYGDLLFPILAQAELTRRLGAVHLQPYAYHRKSAGDWPYAVESLTELPGRAARLDAILIGGGFIVRFDKFIATGYESPSPQLHHPTGYWLSPALIALQLGVPVIWNAPGMHCNQIPSWAEPLLRLALENSACVRVRDELSAQALQEIGSNVRIEVMPDTAFGLPRLIDGECPSVAFRNLRKELGLTERYIVIHALNLAEPYVRLLEDHPEAFADLQVLLIPIGPVLDDDSAALARRLPWARCLPAWPTPLLLAEIIAHAQAVIGYSYHLAITALAFGVPVFCLADLHRGKYTSLAHHSGLHVLPTDLDQPLPWLLERIGKTAPGTAARLALDQLDAYWDQVARLVEHGRGEPAPAVLAFWQNLPNLLEQPTTLGEPSAKLLAAHTSTVTTIESQIARLQAQLAASQARVRQLETSRSLRLTAPLRALAKAFRHSRNNSETSMLDIRRIETAELRRSPFAWAQIDQLYDRQDAAELAATYPLDHFKVVSGYGGEKDYEYHARPLRPLGSDEIAFAGSLSPAWQRLARTLGSAPYRAALSRLTGVDISNAPMEANVFHYGPCASLGAHPDLSDKLVTHILYFNQGWDPRDGGCLDILRSNDANDISATVVPEVGNSAVLVRSDDSWHAVSPVVNGCATSRRSVTVTFYRPGSRSSMWPEGEEHPLCDYHHG